MIDEKKTIITPIITLSPDSSISNATLEGIAEKYMYTEMKDNKIIYKTNIHVLYIDALPDISNDKTNHRTSILSNILGLNTSTHNRVLIPINNITLIGLNTQLINDEQECTLNTYNISNFSLDIIKRKGIAIIMEKIINALKYENVHVILDLSCMDLKSAPSVIRDNTTDGFDIDQITIIMQYLKK